MTVFKGSLIVAVVGKTNAGKSTLVNSLIGEKVSIVTPKPQTTKDNILGILNLKDCQITFVDTPGIHKTLDNSGRIMMKKVRSVMEEVDLILYLVDGTKPLTEEEFENIKNRALKTPLVVIISKIDIAGFEKVYPLLDKFTKIKEIKHVFPISSKEKKNLNLILDYLKTRLIPLKEREVKLSRMEYTTQTIHFMTSEIIREKTLLLLEDEVPHNLIVQIIKFDEYLDITEIDAEIICKKKSQKAIIIGKFGRKLKEISTNARKEIENLLGMKVMLKIYVRSEE